MYPSCEHPAQGIPHQEKPNVYVDLPEVGRRGMSGVAPVDLHRRRTCTYIYGRCAANGPCIIEYIIVN